MPNPLPEKIYARTIWISDTHLGFKDAKVDYLLDFLNRLECDTLYLVGDIIDIWSLRKAFYWPEKHNKIIRKLMEMAKNNCRVIYIPGNHDESFRSFIGEQFGAILIKGHDMHITIEGKRLLVMHGDELDNIIRFNFFTRLIGNSAYHLLLLINRWSNWLRKRCGYDYWSLANYLKKHITRAQDAIHLFEEAASS